jgi:hypothetical protein
MKPVTLQNRSTLPQVVGWFGLECFWTTPSRRSSAWKPLMVSRPARPPANRLVVGRRSSLAGSQLSATFGKTELTAPRISPRCGRERDFDLSLPALSVDQSGLGLAVVLPPWRRGNAPCSAQRYGFDRRHRAAECDAAQCAPHHLWRLSTWVSSQASTAALRYLT